MRDRIKTLICISLAIVLLAGCGSSKNYSKDSRVDYAAEGKYEMADSYGNAVDSPEAVDENKGVASTSPSSVVKDTDSFNRKLIKKYNVDAETKEFDKTLDTIYEKIEAFGGYIESSEINGNSYSYSRNRHAYLVIRVPADKMSMLIEVVKTAGNVTSFNEEVKDVTLDYVDTESRIEALKVEQETLMKMLEQSGDLETLLAIQRELTDVRYELEYYESIKRTFDQQISFGTINLSLDEVIEITEHIDDESFFEELSRKFVGNVKTMIEMSKDSLIFIISAIPFLIPLAVLIAVLVIIFKISRKNKNRKRQKKAEKAENTEKTEE